MKTQANLDNLRIATPCSISWDSMTGNDQVRFCAHCQLNVYNLSELTHTEAQRLIVSTEGRLCERIFRRADGTIITRDCPAGLQALRLKLWKSAAAVFVLIGSLVGSTVGQDQSKRRTAGSGLEQTKITRKQIVSNCQDAEVTGLVLDQNEAVVPSAKVTLTNLTNRDSYQTESSDEGRFKFTGLKPGNYSITTAAAGFADAVVKLVELKLNEATDIEVVLLVARGETGVVAVSETLGITETQVEHPVTLAEIRKLTRKN